jgi:hypothetical protein
LIKRFIAGLTVFLMAALLLASNAWSSPYLQNQPRHSALCGEFAVSNLINWMTAANTTGWQIYRQFPWYHTASGITYHTGKRDLMRAIAGPFQLNVQKFTGGGRRGYGDLRRGFSKAKEAMLGGGAIIMLANPGKLTGKGHFVMGYQFSNGKIAVSDSNRKNPDKWYPVSWLLNVAKGHIYKLWVYS